MKPDIHLEDFSPDLWDVFLSVPFGVIVMDVEGKWKFVNQAARDILGVLGPHDLPESWHDHYGCRYPGSPDKEIPLDDLPGQRALRGLKAEMDVMFHQRDSTEGSVSCHVICVPYRDKKGNVAGVFSVFWPISTTNYSGVEARRALNRAAAGISQLRALNGV